MFSVVYEGYEEVTCFTSESFIEAARFYLTKRQDDSECGYDEESWCVYLNQDSTTLHYYTSED